ncbi:MAG: fructosamine kinase family protein [Acidiferrobacterales bacterium]
MTGWSKIADHIADVTGQPFALRDQRDVGGGCINAAAVLESDSGRVFVKLNKASALEMFAAEFAGLEEIARAAAMRVPTPICFGDEGNCAYLVLQYIEQGTATTESIEQLGRQLAKMHRYTGKQYGWFRDNTIGSTPQVNTPCRSWVDFWRTCRLRFQLELAERRGCRVSLRQKGEQLIDNIDVFFHSYTPAPSLLHGDLWSGNYTVDVSGTPVVFDPAVYYGDREADLAMTELFGGFPARFYDSYRETYPLEAGYEVRKVLYNLYHILNHFNLFGGGYESQAERMIQKLLGEARA